MLNRHLYDLAFEPGPDADAGLLAIFPPRAGETDPDTQELIPPLCRSISGQDSEYDRIWCLAALNSGEYHPLIIESS